MAAPATGYDIATITNPGAALTDFSLMIDLSRMSADWWTAQNDADGTKGRAYKNDGTTELAVDWIDFDGGGETGWARVKYSGTLASSGTQIIRIYPPNSGNAAVAVDDPYGSDNAYDANWIGYWPLSSDFNDRTSSDFDMTAEGGITAGGAAGAVHAATPFDGSAEYLSHAYNAAMDITNGTIIAWAGGTAGVWNGVLSRYNAGSTDGYLMAQRGSSDDISIRCAESATLVESRGGDFDPGINQYVGTWHPTNGTELFENDVSVDADAGTASVPAMSGIALWIGREQLTSSFWDGTLEEIQLHSVVREDEWIAEEYAQTNDNATFWGSWTWTPPAAGGIVVLRRRRAA